MSTSNPFDKVSDKVLEDFAKISVGGECEYEKISKELFCECCSTKELFFTSLKKCLWKLVQKYVKNDSLTCVEDWSKVFLGSLDTCLIYQPNITKYPRKMKQFKIPYINKNVTLNVALAYLYVKIFLSKRF